MRALMPMSRTNYLVSYVKKNIRRFEIRLSKKNDAEIIAWLESQPNVTDYIKTLIVKDQKGDH